ncbi:MAG: IS21 family transposase [Bacilli bacterium]
MKDLMEKSSIIKLKEQGYSNRKVEKLLKINRKTVAKYWNEYKDNLQKLNNTKDNLEIVDIQEKITSKPQYNSSSRVKRKITPEFIKSLKKILIEETEKTKILGTNKQALTKIQIYELLKSQGFTASYSSVAVAISRIKNSGKECFIRQEYNFGDRLEYDFGEVKLVINGILKKYYIAVLSSPAGNFRWCYLYDNCKKEVFMDSHVRFFKMLGGVYKEVVYDNMRNVVTKFIGKNEKELNTDLIKMSLYYGFDVNVTNAFSGNEKGYVEGSVKYLRNKIFATNYKFQSEESAIEYMESQLIKLNEESKIEEEKSHLKSVKPPLELANITESVVNKYSFIQIENNFYSVPEYLVGMKVTSKIYYNKILIYSNYEFVCEHKKVDGTKKISADIRHYLKTLSQKPGALKNSNVLKSNPILKAIYNRYYTQKPKQFIQILTENKEKSDNELKKILIEKSTNLITIKEENKINELTRKQTSMYNNIMMGVVNE